MVYQLRFVLWNYSRDTHETNQELLRRKGLKTAQQQLQGRLLQFLKRQAEADPTLIPLYLPRARKLADKLQQLKPQEYHTDPRSGEVTCSECGAVFSGTGPLRRHMQKQHATSRTMQKGPKFDPSVHSLKGTASCTACGAHFSSFFSLRKHVETTTCPRSDQELPIEIQHQQEAQARLRAAVSTDLDAAARDPAHHSLFMESCVLCGQTIPAQKGIKQHLNRQHPEIMEALATILPPRLQQFKFSFIKGTLADTAGTV